MNKKRSLLVFGILFVVLFISSIDSAQITTFNNSLTEENLTFTGEESIIRYLEIPEYAHVESAHLNLSGYNSDYNNKNYMVLWHHMNNDSTYGENDTHVFDFSKNGNNGTVIGAKLVDGKFNLGYNFTDTDFINTSNSATLNSVKNITINFWLKTNTFGDGYTIINKSGSYTVELLEGSGACSGQGTIRWWVQVEEGTHQQRYELVRTSDEQSISDNNWHHISLYWKGSGDEKMKIIIDGEIASTCGTGYIGSGSIKESNSDLIIGNFNGRLDELVIFNESFVNQNKTIYNYIPTYPNTPHLEIGTQDGTYEWEHTREFNITEQTEDLSSAINSALNDGACNCEGCQLKENKCIIPFIFHSDTAGILQYSDININYESTFVPYTGATKDVDLGTKNITTTGHGFFSWLGGLTSRITGLFVQDIDASGNVNIGGEITVEENLNVSGNVTANWIFIDGITASGDFEINAREMIFTTDDEDIEISASEEILIQSGDTYDLTIVSGGGMDFYASGDFTFDNEDIVAYGGDVYGGEFIENSVVLDKQGKTALSYFTTTSEERIDIDGSYNHKNRDDELLLVYKDKEFCNVEGVCIIEQIEGKSVSKLVELQRDAILELKSELCKKDNTYSFC